LWKKKKISLGTNVHEIENKIKHKYKTKIFNGLNNIFYFNKTLTDQCLNVYFFEFERVISLNGNRTAV
jgi:hypothetical protein